LHFLRLILRSETYNKIITANLKIQEVEMSENKTYYDDLVIDPHDLDSECIDQPRRFMKWGEAFADAIFGRDKAKQNLKIVTAQTEQAIRLDPQANNVVEGARGVTEGAIQAALSVHKDVIAAEDALILAEKNLAVLKTAKEAFEDRKRQLSNMVQLKIAQYYSDPEKLADKEIRATHQENLAKNERLQNLKEEKG
jgi:hypothetical protein